MWFADTFPSGFALPSHSHSSFALLSRTKVFKLDMVQVIIFPFKTWALGVKFLPSARSPRFSFEVKFAQSCPTLCDPMDCSPPGSSVHGDSPGKNTGVGCHFLLQGIFQSQRLNPGLLHCRQILYCLSHQGSPMIFFYVFLKFYDYPSDL